MKLNEIADNAGAKKDRKRIGRGLGSGKGKTGGRGGKGQTARKGGAKAGFEGGQMPIYRRLPKRGFNKPNEVPYNEVTLARVAEAVEAKKIDVKAPVTGAALYAAGVITKLESGGVRLIGNTEMKSKISFEVFYASKGAVASVEKAGGSVKISRTEKVETPGAAAAKAAAAPKAAAPVKAAAPAKAPAPAKVAEVKFVDDVSLIDGIGPKITKQLAEAGVTTLKQIAEMDAAAMAALDEKLELKGRSLRDEWVVQAQELVAGKPPRAKIDQAKL